MGTGYNVVTIYKDFWEYDPATDTWTQKADFGGTARTGAVGFSIGSKGYIGTGHMIGSLLQKDFWEYDPAANTWTQKADFGGTARKIMQLVSASAAKDILERVYRCKLYKDFWEYTADFGVGIPFIKNDTSALSVFPNPFESSVTILLNQSLHDANLILYDLLGHIVKRINNINTRSIDIERDGLPAGIYLFTLMQDGQSVTSGKITAE